MLDLHSLTKPTNFVSQRRSKPQDKFTPKGYCFKFHRGVNKLSCCLVVLLSNYVVSVKVHIWSVSVIFLARVEPP